MTINRRSFLGSLLGLGALAVARPILRPRGTAFSFLGGIQRPRTLHLPPGAYASIRLPDGRCGSLEFDDGVLSHVDGADFTNVRGDLRFLELRYQAPGSPYQAFTFECNLHVHKSLTIYSRPMPAFSFAASEKTMTPVQGTFSYSGAPAVVPPSPAPQLTPPGAFGGEYRWSGTWAFQNPRVQPIS